MVKKEKTNLAVRVTIDKELFDIIFEQAQSMNDVCHGVFNISIEPGNKIFREASKIVARKIKGDI
jgi:hypothetical protein